MGLILRDYQQKIIEELRTSILKGNKRICRFTVAYVILFLYLCINKKL